MSLPCVLVLAAALVAVAAVYGAEADASGRFDVVPVLSDAVERTLHEPAVAAVAAASLAILLALAVRVARLRYLVWRATLIRVPDFESAGLVSDAERRRLEIRFRSQLCRQHLTAPGAQPGGAADADVLSLISDAAQASGIVAMAAALLRLAWPPHAYVVRCTLLQRSGGEENCGVSAQVIVVPSLASSPTVCWSATFDGAVDHAANHAAAFIVPRRRSKSPWRNWKGKALPSGLVDVYEQGSASIDAARDADAARASECYGDALRAFRRALEDDPKNLDIRLRVGFLYEKLRAPLDALFTYQSIVEFGEMLDQSRGLRRRLPAITITARAQAATLRLADYRYAIILGEAETLASEWYGDAPHPRDNRVELREFLRPRLQRLYDDRVGTSPAAAPIPEALLPRWTPPPDVAPGACFDDATRPLKTAFQRIALTLLGELESHTPRHLLVEERTLTRPAIALSSWCVCRRLRRNGAALPNEFAWLAQTDADVEALRTAVCARLPRRPTWSELYNAASLYALYVLCGDAEREQAAGSDPPPSQDRVWEGTKERFAEAAVDELRRAVADADSAYIASRRRWLAHEDPDLAALRDTPAYTRFRAECLPEENDRRLSADA